MSLVVNMSSRCKISHFCEKLCYGRIEKVLLQYNKEVLYSITADTNIYRFSNILTSPWIEIIDIVIIPAHFDNTYFVTIFKAKRNSSQRPQLHWANIRTSFHACVRCALANVTANYQHSQVSFLSLLNLRPFFALYPFYTFYIFAILRRRPVFEDYHF